MYNYYGDVSSITFYKKYTREDRLPKSPDEFISLASYEDRETMLIANVFKGGRQFSFASSVLGLDISTDGSIYNFGSDGETAQFRGLENSGILVSLSKGAFGSYYGDYSDIGKPTFMNRVEAPIDSTVSLNGAGNPQDMLLISVERYGRHCDFCGTMYGLGHNTKGTVYSFGTDGGVLTVNGDGNYGLVFTTDVEGISSVNVTITNINRNTKGLKTMAFFENAAIGNKEVTALNNYVNAYDLFFVSINQNGRHCGFMAMGYDLLNLHNGAVLNFGADGAVVELVGSPGKGLYVSLSNGGSYNLTVVGMVVQAEYRVGDTIKINTFKDFHMVPENRLGVNPPSPQYVITNIAGTSNQLDITEYLTDKATKQSRTGSWSFYIDHYKWPDWPSYYETISRFLNGFKVSLILEEDKYKSYLGYVTVTGYSVGASYSKISLSYDLNVNTTPSVGNAPIRFIKSDGSYHGLDYIFDPGFDYLIELPVPFYGETVRCLSLGGGIYLLTPVRVGTLISFAGVENKNAVIFLGGCADERFFGTIAKAEDLLSVTAGEIFNFGSDGHIATLKEDGHTGMIPKTSNGSIEEILVTIREPVCSYILDHAEVNTGELVDLSSVSNRSAVLGFSIFRYGQHLFFCSTADDICKNTRGTLYSFGLSGEMLRIVGDGSNSFKIAASDDSVVSVSLSVMSFQSENLYTNEQYKSGDEINIAYPVSMGLVFVSISYDGRRAGFCTTQHDLSNCMEGKVLNFGSDGEIVEIVGYGERAMTVASEIAGENPLSVTVDFMEFLDD